MQVIGGGTAEGGGPSLLLFFDEHRYMFGCGEGTQRACFQHQVRLSRLRAVFLSRLEWTHSGGLPGMICTVADSGGVTNVQLVGPPGTVHLVASLRAFLRRSHLALSIIEALGDAQGEQKPLQQDEDGAAKDGSESAPGSDPIHLQEAEGKRIRQEEHQLPPDVSSTIPAMAPMLPTVYEDQVIRVRALEIRRTGRVERPIMGGKRPRIGDTGSHPSSPKAVHHLDNIHIHGEGRPGDPSACHHQVIMTMFKSPLSDSCHPSQVQGGGQSEGVGPDPEQQPQHPCPPDSSDAHLRDAKPLPPFKFAGSSLCWVVEGPGRPGKFNAIRARQLGIPPGSLYGQLAQGRSVTLADGRHIEPSQCVGRAQPGPVFVVLSVEREHLLALFETIHKLAWDRIQLVFHQCTVDIWRDPEYQQRIIKGAHFPSNTQHIWIDMGQHHVADNVLADQNDPDRLVLPATVELSQMLASQVNPHMFSLAPVGQASPNERAKPLTRYYWYKNTNTAGMETPSNCTPEPSPPSRSRSRTATAAATPTVLPLSSTIPPPLTASTLVPPPSPANPTVTFLGTAAALPGKYRNVSSTLVDWGTAALLLDCGEGTYGQLVRKFGPGGTEGILNRLTAILISHLHADHQLGVPGILERLRRRQSDRPLILVAPSRYRLFLEELGQCVFIGTGFTFIPTESIVANEGDTTVDAISGGGGGEEAALDPFWVQAVPVIHCPHAYGYVVTHRTSAIKVTFSGDTRPCERLARAGAASHILIHEATFGDGHEQEALEKRHCTVREALDVATLMGARHTLLTHISQRYAKTCPPHDWAAEGCQGRGALPVIDFMSVSLHQLETMDICNMRDRLLAALPDTEPESESDTEAFRDQDQDPTRMSLA